MYKILTYNNISKKGLKIFDLNYEYCDTIKNPHAIVVRSNSLHDIEFNEELIAIARAGVGTNNIPIEKCSQNGIVVFNTPGANSNAVKELVISAIILSSRRFDLGVEWVKKLVNEDSIQQIVEKGKSAFKGCEIQGKRLGVIGLGAIGRLVANDCIKLGMDVYGYDPYISIENAWKLSSYIHRTISINDMFSKCDYITLHIPLNERTKNIINNETIKQMKNNVKLLNFSRADLVNSNDLIEALKTRKVSCYVTDFPTKAFINVENCIQIPHLGASTKESEDNCSIMAINQIKSFLSNGNIKNAVNLPNISMNRSGKSRLTVFHNNAPKIISILTNVLSEADINIINMQSSAKEDYAYTIIDAEQSIPQSLLANFVDNKNIIKTRII